MTVVVAFLAVVAPLILFHELGHFLAAKATGIHVEEFALGFGPRLLGVQRGGTLYAVNLLPLGGYVRLRGMDPGSPRGEPGSFQSRPLWARVLTIAAGPLSNFVLAAVLFAAVPVTVGLPTLPPGPARVGGLVPGYPAAKAGIRPGDVIVAVDGRRVGSWAALMADVSRAPAGEALAVTVQRGTERFTVRLVPRQAGSRRIMGVYPVTVLRRLPLWAAAGLGAVQTWQVTGSWFSALAHSVQQGKAPHLSGPVGIAEMVGQAEKAGQSSVLELAGLLSANLGLINLLPFPALDGSRLLFLGVEAVRRRPMDPQREGMIHFIGFAMLMILMLFLTYRDLLRLGQGS